MTLPVLGPSRFPRPDRAILSVACLGLALVASTPVQAQRTRGGSSSAQSGCFITPFRFCDNCAAKTTIKLAAGSVCYINLRASASVALLSQKVAIRPTNGVYGSANTYAGAYKANDGARGSDRFAVDIVYDRSGTRYTTRLIADVTITP